MLRQALCSPLHGLGGRHGGPLQVAQGDGTGQALDGVNHGVDQKRRPLGKRVLHVQVDDGWAGRLSRLPVQHDGIAKRAVAVVGINGHRNSGVAAALIEGGHTVTLSPNFACSSAIRCRPDSKYLSFASTPM